MTVTSVHDPSHREALWELEAAFERGDLITAFGRCTVSYTGRAASELGSGDRLVVLKPDGAALVHTDEGRTPVNWQPPGSEHHAAVREGRLRVRSVRSSPAETLTVRFSDVHQLSTMTVTGGRDLDLHGSEEDLRTRVLERPALVDPGFEPRETERPTSAGPIDVFGVDGAGRPVVVELKRRRVGPDAVGQLDRYVEAVREEYRTGGSGDDRADTDGDDGDVHSDGDDGNDGDGDDGDDHAGRDDHDGDGVRGVLVAPSITDRAAALLADRGFEHVALDPRPEGTGGDGSVSDDAGADDDRRGRNDEE